MDLFSVEERVWEEVLKAVGKKMRNRLMSVSGMRPGGWSRLAYAIFILNFIQLTKCLRLLHRTSLISSPPAYCGTLGATSLQNRHRAPLPPSHVSALTTRKSLVTPGPKRRLYE